MTSHFELLSHFCNFHVEIRIQFGVSLKALRSENVGEHFLEAVRSYLCKNGILHQSSCVDTTSQNGVAK